MENETLESGGCFDLYLPCILTLSHKNLLKNYENYLMTYKGFSFILEYRKPNFTLLEKFQLKLMLGFVPYEKIQISGIVTPVFRSMEAILDYFGGYAKLGVGKDFIKSKTRLGRVYRIYFKILPPDHSYLLIDSKTIASSYNYNDPQKIKDIYSIEKNILQIH